MPTSAVAARRSRRTTTVCSTSAVSCARSFTMVILSPWLRIGGVMAVGPVGQIHISVSDLDRAIEFYRDVLGIPMLFRVPGQEMAFFSDPDGQNLALMQERP